GAIAIVVKRNEEQADIFGCARPADSGCGLLKGFVALRQGSLNGRKLFFRAVLRSDVAESLQNLVENMVGWRKDGAAQFLIFKKVDDFAEREVLQEATENDAAAGIGSDHVKILQNCSAGGALAVNFLEGFDLNEGPGTTAVQGKNAIRHG